PPGRSSPPGRDHRAAGTFLGPDPRLSASLPAAPPLLRRRPPAPGHPLAGGSHPVPERGLFPGYPAPIPLRSGRRLSRLATRESVLATSKHRLEWPTSQFSPSPHGPPDRGVVPQ